MSRTHHKENYFSDEEPSRHGGFSADPPSERDSDSSKNLPRNPDAKLGREKWDGRVPTNSLNAKDIAAREERDRARRQRWNLQNQLLVVQDPNPKGKGDTNPSPADDVENRERHPTGAKVKTSANSGKHSTGTQDSSASSSSSREIAAILTAEEALKAALSEFSDTLFMYHDMDQLFDEHPSWQKYHRSFFEGVLASTRNLDRANWELVEVRTRPGSPWVYQVATRKVMNTMLAAIEVDGLVERLSRPMKRHELRSELETIRSKLVAPKRVVDSEE